jgi:hypothetical protein
MTRALLAAVLAFGLCGVVFAQKKTDVTVVESRARRVEEGRVSVDARVKVTGAKPVRGLVVFFDFVSSEGDPLISAKVEADEDDLKPGEETSLRAATTNPPGAVRYKIHALDGAGRELRVGNAGPFTIE